MAARRPEQDEVDLQLTPPKRQKTQTLVASSSRIQIRNDEEAMRGKMAKLRRTGKLCDVDVTVEGQTFRAHRIVLASGSDYFEALFGEARFSDSTTNAIELPEMSATTFELFLEWLYTGSCDLSEETLMELLSAASRLQCVGLLDKLQVTMVERIKPELCLEYWVVADRLNLPTLASKAERKALRWYCDVSCLDQFKDLSFAHLVKLVASNELCVYDEAVVFESVLAWVKAQNPQPAADQLGELFSHVRFPLMAKPYISAHVEKELQNLSSKEVMLSFYRGFKEKVLVEKSPQTKKRKGHSPTLDELEVGLLVRVSDIPNYRVHPSKSEAVGLIEEINKSRGVVRLFGLPGTLLLHNCLTWP